MPEPARKDENVLDQPSCTIAVDIETKGQMRKRTDREQNVPKTASEKLQDMQKRQEKKLGGSKIARERPQDAQKRPERRNATQ